MSRPYRMQRIGILNHTGDIWTPETFDHIDQAQAYIAAQQHRYPKWDLSKHRPAPVRVTLSVVKPRKAKT